MAFEVLFNKYTNYLKLKNYSSGTIHRYSGELKEFKNYLLEEKGIERIQDVTKAVLTDYQNKVYSKNRLKDNAPLSLSSKTLKLIAVKNFFSFLARKAEILYNPAFDMDLPKARRDGLKEVLKESQIKKILESIKGKTPVELRDRAILELLYSTGMRNSELRSLEKCDIDLEKEEVRIRHGKGYFGHKERVLPIGRLACACLEAYEREARPKLLETLIKKGVRKYPTAFFITKSGRPLRIETPTDIFKKYAALSHIKTKVYAHLLRHSCATHLLEHGADIRHVQEILGHASLDSTRVYTKITIGHLKKIHQKTHPRERQ